MQEELQLSSSEHDELLMSLVEMALSRPPNEREAYLRSACADRPELLEQTMSYVLSEQRMNGFLLEPLIPPAPQEQPLQPGNLLQGRFRIVREVAQGGMGVVYEARDEKLERRIAIKCAKAGFGKRLPPEVRNASEISHPNVCKIFEIHTAVLGADEIDFLTMEFLEGETLSERMQRGPIEFKEAKLIARQLCEGLAEAHRNQVIHGDLKSNNIILTRGADQGTRAVITDFGLASKAAAARFDPQSGTLAGTPDYMAPELLKGGKPSPASDLYALGVILFEVATGRKPCPPEATWEERIVRKAPPVKHPWNAILQRCLDPDPARRCSDAAEAGRLLAPPVPRRKLVAAAVLTVVLAVAFSLWMYARSTASLETVRLAVLPFESTPDTAPVAKRTLEAVTTGLGRAKGNGRTKFLVLPLSRASQEATHVLHASLRQQNKALLVHANLTNNAEPGKSREWTAEYPPDEVRYVPVALAGLVTGTLHIPPLRKDSAVNAAARQDYLAGLRQLRADTGVDAALESLRKAVVADPDSPLTHAALAEAQWFKYKLSGGTEAREWLQRVTASVHSAERRNPDLAPVHRIAGLLALDSGLYEHAVEEYLRAIELDPGNGDAYRRLGMAYESRGQLSEALAEYQRAVDAEPGNFRNHQTLGAFYQQRANYNDALPHFKKAIELAPEEPRPRFALAATYLYLGWFADAERELRKSVALQQTSAAVHTLGLVMMYQRREQEAIPYFLTSLRLNSQEHLSRVYLGICYRRINRLAQARLVNQSGLELTEVEMARDPRNGYIRSFLAYFAATLGDRFRAQSEIAQALKLSPDDADLRWTAVLTYEALGLRDATLALLASGPGDLVADLSRWPDVADLHEDSRFKKLLASHQEK